MSKSSRSSKTDDTDKDEKSDCDVYKASDLDSTLRIEEDEYSYSDDDFSETSQDSSEDERKSDNNEDESFDDKYQRKLSIVKTERSGHSNSRSGTFELHSHPQAQVAKLRLSDDEEDYSPRTPVIRRYSRELTVTPRSGTFPSILEPVKEAQAPVNQGYYTTSIVPSTPRNMTGVDYNQSWEKQAGGTGADVYREEVHSSSDEKEDSVDEYIVPEEPIVDLIETDLGHGIVVKHPVKYDFKDSFACRPWPLDRRIEEGVDITLGFQEVTCCDIYEVYTYKGRRSVLKFDNKDEKYVIFSIRIKYLFRSEDVSYVAKIKQGTKWESVSADLKDENVTFHTTELESVYVICFPTQSRYLIKPEGLEIKPEHLDGDRLHFPSNFVDKPKPTSIQFSSVDKIGMDKRHKLYPDIFKLKAVSRRVYVEHDIPMSSKSMFAELSLEVLGDNHNLEDLEIVGFRWKDGDVSLMSKEECKAKKIRKNTISLQTDGLVNESGFSLGLALPGFTEINAKEIKLAYRDEYICRFFIHIRKTGARSATVFIDCVKIEDIKILLKNYVTVFKIGESDNIYLRDFQRIRIDTTGSSLRKKDIKHDKCFVYFFASSEKNHLEFKIEQNQGLGVSPSTTLKFSMDNYGPKRVVHQQDFEPWSISTGSKTDAGQKKIEQISRGNTMLNMFKSKR